MDPCWGCLLTGGRARLVRSSRYGGDLDPPRLRRDDAPAASRAALGDDTIEVVHTAPEEPAGISRAAVGVIADVVRRCDNGRAWARRHPAPLA